MREREIARDLSANQSGVFTVSDTETETQEMLTLCKKLKTFEVLWLVSLCQEKTVLVSPVIFLSFNIFSFTASFPCKKNKSTYGNVEPYRQTIPL